MVIHSDDIIFVLTVVCSAMWPFSVSSQGNEEPVTVIENRSGKVCRKAVRTRFASELGLRARGTVEISRNGSKDSRDWSVFFQAEADKTCVVVVRSQQIEVSFELPKSPKGNSLAIAAVAERVAVWLETSPGKSSRKIRSRAKKFARAEADSLIANAKHKVRSTSSPTGRNTVAGRASGQSAVSELERWNLIFESGANVLPAPGLALGVVRFGIEYELNDRVNIEIGMGLPMNTDNWSPHPKIAREYSAWDGTILFNYIRPLEDFDIAAGLGLRRLQPLVNETVEYGEAIEFDPSGGDFGDARSETVQYGLEFGSEFDHWTAILRLQARRKLGQHLEMTAAIAGLLGLTQRRLQSRKSAALPPVNRRLGPAQLEGTIGLNWHF